MTDDLLLASSQVFCLPLTHHSLMTMLPKHHAACSRRLSVLGRQFIYLMWSVLQAVSLLSLISQPLLTFLTSYSYGTSMLEYKIAWLRAELDDVSSRPASAEAADSKTPDEVSLHLTTADTERRTKACVESQCRCRVYERLISTLVAAEQTQTAEKSLTLDKSTMVLVLAEEEVGPISHAHSRTSRRKLARLGLKSASLRRKHPYWYKTNLVSDELRRTIDTLTLALTEGSGGWGSAHSVSGEHLLPEVNTGTRSPGGGDERWLGDFTFSRSGRDDRLAHNGAHESDKGSRG